MSDNPIPRIDYDEDPERCQGVITDKGQCINKAVKGGTFCLVHGGNKQTEAMEAQSLKNYRLDRFKARIEQKVVSPGIKSLREEIGILRMVLEERLNFCKSDTDLLINSQSISDLVVKIEKLVTSCHKLEGSMRQLLDKSALLQFAQEIIQIIGTHVTNEKDLNSIADEIIAALSTTGEEPKVE